jgi:hypothetical protein
MNDNIITKLPDSENAILSVCKKSRLPKNNAGLINIRGFSGCNIFYLVGLF